MDIDDVLMGASVVEDGADALRKNPTDPEALNDLLAYALELVNDCKAAGATLEADAA